jgi:glycosyltransferase involved in cell wall biosynthesis
LINSTQRSVLIIGPYVPHVLHWKMFLFIARDPRYRLASFVGNPLLGNTHISQSTFMCCTCKSRFKTSFFPRAGGNILLSIVLDMVETFRLIHNEHHRYDACISVSPHLALLALFLRFTGVTDTVVYWTLDFFPFRFKSLFLNHLYHALDKLLSNRADWLWSVSSFVIKFREARGLAIRQKSLVVPYAVLDEEIIKDQVEYKKPFSLLYTGNLSFLYGFDLILDALPIVLKRFPETVITVVSYSGIPSSIIKKIQESGLARSFRLLGHVSDSELQQIYKDHMIGLAPYRRDTTKLFADPSRVKDFLAKGIPVIVTRYVGSSDIVSRNNAGLVIEYDKYQLANAICRLFSDPDLYERCRKNTFIAATSFRAPRFFGEALDLTFSSSNVKQNRV